MRVLVCVILCTMCMLTEVAAMRWMRVLVCVFLCTRRMLFCDCCEAMDACACFCVLVRRAHAHGDFCKAFMCVLVCMFLFTRRMLTVIAARPCICVLLFVWSHTQCAWSP